MTVKNNVTWTIKVGSKGCESDDSCNAGSQDATCSFNSLESKATIKVDRVSVGHH